METQDLVIFKLKKIVKERFANQKAFCQSFGISESQFSAYLKGKNYIGIDLLDRIAKHCEVHISYFFNDESNAEIINYDSFNEIFFLAYNFALENDLEVKGSYFLACYDLIITTMHKESIKDIETAFNESKRLILKFAKNS